MMPRPIDGHRSSVTRRSVLRAAAGGFGQFFVAPAGGVRWAAEAVGTPMLLDPRSIPKVARCRTRR